MDKTTTKIKQICTKVSAFFIANQSQKLKAVQYNSFFFFLNLNFWLQTLVPSSMYSYTDTGLNSS